MGEHQPNVYGALKWSDTTEASFSSRSSGPARPTKEAARRPGGPTSAVKQQCPGTSSGRSTEVNVVGRGEGSGGRAGGLTEGRARLSGACVKQSEGVEGGGVEGGVGPLPPPTPGLWKYYFLVGYPPGQPTCCSTCCRCLGGLSRRLWLPPPPGPCMSAPRSEESAVTAFIPPAAAPSLLRSVSHSATVAAAPPQAVCARGVQSRGALVVWQGRQDAKVWRRSGEQADPPPGCRVHALTPPSVPFCATLGYFSEIPSHLACPLPQAMEPLQRPIALCLV